jgi:hypothetical protein
MVTLRAEGAGGVGFALPIEYARNDLLMPQRDEAAAQRWAATLARIREEDDAEAAKLLAKLERPMLLGAYAVGPRLGVAVMQRVAYRPSSVPVTLRVSDSRRLFCEPEGAITEWRPLEEKLKQASEQDHATRLVRWMVRRKLSAETWAGTGVVDLAACDGKVLGPATVTVKGASEDEAASYPAGELSLSRRQAEVDTRMEDAARAQSEAEWRAAFRGAKERVAELEAKRKALRDAMDRTDNGTLARAELEAVERALRKAREELDDLERRASHEAVPHAWR